MATCIEYQGVLVKMAIDMASTSISKAVMTTAATWTLGEPREGPGCDGRITRQNRYPVAKNIGVMSQFMAQSCHDPQL